MQTYHRLSPLVVMNKALGSVAELQEGDCMVAFSRRAVHGLKREVLRRTPHQCAVVYGKSCKHSRLWNRTCCSWLCVLYLLNSGAGCIAYLRWCTCCPLLTVDLPVPLSLPSCLLSLQMH